MTTTTSQILLNSTRPAALAILKCAEWAAANGGSFSVKDEHTNGEWFTTIVINWPPAAQGKHGEKGAG